LEAQRAYLASVIDELPVGVFIAESNPKKKDIKWKLVNRAAQQIATDHPTPGSVTDVYTIHHLDGTLMADDELPLQHTLWTGEPSAQTEVLLRFKNGEERVFLMTSAILTEEEGRREGIVVVQDITERKRLEAETVKLSARLAHIIDQMPVGVFIAEGSSDEQAVYPKLVNAVGRRQLPLPKLLETGTFRSGTYMWPDGGLIDEEDLPMQYTIRTGEAIPPMELLVRYDTGEERAFLLTSALLGEENGRREAIVVAQDITERKRAELERERLFIGEQEARREAEEAVHTRDELLAIVSHDLKNPLTTIKGNSQLMKRRISQAQLNPDDAQRLMSAVERVDESANKMNQMINDLLDFGRLQGGQALSLQRRPTNLVVLARTVAAEFQRTTVPHQIEVDATVHSVIGQWDATRLEQVLGNLLTNAIKYSPNGGTITLKVGRETVEEEGVKRDYAVLAVQDCGMGISKEDLPHIFEWFRRAKNISGRISGAGIGLASANYIVTQHGGSITVSSEHGKGSTFTIRLPL
jgi:signal transduction histidine kinase